MQNSNRVGQFEQETAKIENQVGSNLHGYDVSGNAIYEHAFNKGLLLYKIYKADNIWMVSNISIIFGRFSKR